MKISAIQHQPGDRKMLVFAWNGRCASWLLGRHQLTEFDNHRNKPVTGTHRSTLITSYDNNFLLDLGQYMIVSFDSSIVLCGSRWHRSIRLDRLDRLANAHSTRLDFLPHRSTRSIDSIDFGVYWPNHSYLPTFMYYNHNCPHKIFGLVYCS